MSLFHKGRALNPRNILEFLLHEERRGSVLLLAAATLALCIAQSSLAHTYFNALSTDLTVLGVHLTIQEWINEFLMVLFFLVVGLEVKREFVDGELQTWRRASFPVVAAIGGMIVPALIYALFNPTPPTSAGWAIPMATDIAFAIGVLGLLGKRIPKIGRVFLLTLAIVDDIGSLIVIALFYNQPSNVLAFIVALFCVVGLLLARRSRHWPTLFLFIGLLMSYSLLLAGISATIAGVVVALLMPLSTSRAKFANLQMSEVIEDALIPITTFVVVPIFVFANAGIKIAPIISSLNDSFAVFLGVFIGLVVGKPVGILLASWIGTSLGVTHKPRGLSWSVIGGLGALSGIGFTISLLVSHLAFADQATYQDAAVASIFVASVVAGGLGLFVLNRSTSK